MKWNRDGGRLDAGMQGEVGRGDASENDSADRGSEKERERERERHRAINQSSKVSICM